MAIRSTALRLRFLNRDSYVHGTLQSRASSTRILNEEERAAENIYIKKMEKEKLEKHAKEGGNPEKNISSSSVPESGTQALPHPPVSNTSSDPNKNVAVAAAVVTLVASGWWFYRANKKVVVEEE